MTGEEYEFFSNGTDTYGDIKEALLPHLLDDNSLRHDDIILVDWDYNVVKDTTKIPSLNLVKLHV